MLAVVAWVLGPWLVAILRTLSAEATLSQIAWSLARAAETTEQPPPEAVTVPGIGTVTVSWSGSIGRCGIATVTTHATLAAPRFDVLGPGAISLAERATVSGDTFVGGAIVGACGGT